MILVPTCPNLWTCPYKKNFLQNPLNASPQQHFFSTNQMSSLVLRMLMLLDGLGNSWIIIWNYPPWNQVKAQTTHGTARWSRWSIPSNFSAFLGLIFRTKLAKPTFREGNPLNPWRWTRTKKKHWICGTMYWEGWSKGGVTWWLMIVIVTSSGFVIITWNNPKKWENPYITNGQTLPVNL